MKKFVKLLLISILLFISLNTQPVEAKTLGDLYDELQELEAKHEKQIEDAEDLAAAEAATKLSIQRTNAELVEIEASIEQTNIDIELTLEKIRQTEIKIDDTKGVIKTKDEEVKLILRFFQKSRGIPQYLTFMFGAKDLEDFSRRYIITKRISEYNNEIIAQMEDELAKLQQLETDLHEQETYLNEFQIFLEAEQKRLDETKIVLFKKLDEIGDSIAELDETGETLEYQIDASKKMIEYYEGEGCKLNDQLSECAVEVPSSTKFYAPTDAGLITSNFGPRSFILNGKPYSDYHSGIDIANGYNNVYAAAAGKVVYTYYDPYNLTPGGNCIVLNHIVNGQKYTTAYYHLSSINKSIGDLVTSLDKIGNIGNSGSSTTGAHLHFTIATGWRYGTGPDSYTSYSTYRLHWVDPRTKIKFPTRGYWYYSRDIGK